MNKILNLYLYFFERILKRNIYCRGIVEFQMRMTNEINGSYLASEALVNRP
jgi:hypothetical protein